MFISVITVSSLAGLLCALVVLQLLHSGGERVLLHCTILLPVLRLVTGLLCMLYPWNKFTPDEAYKQGDGLVRDLACATYFLFGAALATGSIINCCISLRVRHLARPWLGLQANLMRTVSRIVLANPGMLLVPLGCALLLYFWIVACISALTAILRNAESSWAEAAILPAFVLICWGGGTGHTPWLNHFFIIARRKQPARCCLLRCHPGLLWSLQPMVPFLL